MLEGLLRDAAPADADVTMAWHHADPSLFEPDLPALVLGAQAIERATGAAPALIRSGGSIPVVAEFAAREIPTPRSRSAAISFACSRNKICFPAWDTMTTTGRFLFFPSPTPGVFKTSAGMINDRSTVSTTRSMAIFRSPSISDFEFRTSNFVSRLSSNRIQSPCIC